MADQPSDSAWAEWESLLEGEQGRFEALADIGVMEGEVSLHNEFRVLGASAYFTGRLRIETAARLRVGSVMNRLSMPEALERAIATQWFIDEQLLRGRRVVIEGPGRRRQEVVFPVRPAASTEIQRESPLQRYRTFGNAGSAEGDLA